MEREPENKKLPEHSITQKETDRQLSKKELKKKGLEELDAVLAELGLETGSRDESRGNLCLHCHIFVIIVHFTSDMLGLSPFPSLCFKNSFNFRIVVAHC